MGKIKIKHRNPKRQEFTPNDIVINVKNGTLFYKSDNGLFRVQGDNLGTSNTEILPNNFFKGDLTVEGNLIPSETDIYELGSSTKQWNHLHVKHESIKMYKDGVEVGNLSYISGSGLKVKDRQGNTKGIIGNVDGGSF